MKVSEMMSSSVISILPEDTVDHAARLLSQYDIGALPICTVDGELRGIVTDRDIALRCIAADFPPAATQVRGIMTRSPVTVEAHADLKEAAKRMADSQVRRLPVMQEGKVVGMISLCDLARSQHFDMEVAVAFGEISTHRTVY